MAEPPLWVHQAFDDVLATLEASGRGKVSRERMADVLTRLMVAAPRTPSQAEIGQGDMLLLPYRIAADSVSRAIAALAGESIALVTQHRSKADRPGRPYTPLQLGSPQWAMVGVKIGHKAEHPVSLNVAVTDLDGRPIDLVGRGDNQPYIREIDENDDLVERLAEVIEELCSLPPLRRRYILGVGIEVPGHVFEGEVIDASHASMRKVALGLELSQRLEGLARRLNRLTGRTAPLPVIVDNEVNVLAVIQTYRPEFPERDLAVVAVFDDGIGSALILDGRVYRGGRGMAGEIGHCFVGVDLDQAAEPGRGDDGSVDESSSGEGPTTLPTFSDPCHCGRNRHLDCYATPVRIMGELGESDFSEESFAVVTRRVARRDGVLTRAGKIFQMAGQALGMAIASNLINSIDPSRVLVLLPPALTESWPGSTAEIYRQSMKATIDLHAFSDAADYTKVTLQPLSAERRRFLGAQGAAIRVLDSLLQHATHRCRCYVPLPRPNLTAAATDGSSVPAIDYDLAGTPTGCSTCSSAVASPPAASAGKFALGVSYPSTGP